MNLEKATDSLMSSPTQRAQVGTEDGCLDTLPSAPTAVSPSLISRAVTAYEDMKIDGHVSYRHSPLSRRVSHSLETSLEVMDSASLSIKNYSRKDSSNLERNISQGQFHFSVHTWSGKGVTLVMPSRPSLRHESRFKRLPEIVVQEVDVILHADNTSSLATACKNQPKDLDMSVKVPADTYVDADPATMQGLLTTKSESKFLRSNETERPGRFLSVLL